MDAREGAELGVVSGRDETALGRDRLSAFPNFRDLDVVDAVAPRVPLRVHGLVLEIGERQPIELSAVELAKFPILGLETLSELSGQRSLDVLLQQSVRIVLISEGWRALMESQTLLSLAEADAS